jgi:hypothetical protein
MAKTSFTYLGSEAGSPEPLLRLSPATGREADMLDVSDPVECPQIVSTDLDVLWLIRTFGEARVNTLLFQTLMWDGLLGVISPVNSFKPKHSVKRHHQKRR